ncbi:MAG: low-specificity L-threonine aldolase [Negativicutes bacterium]|nr:low-specificity L-threonine aldolase [Negativicutes bacterium]
MTVIDLRSDTVTRPTAAMREAMYRAEVGDDVFGDDPTVRELEEYAADMCGKPAALFVVSGTMGNQLAILSHCRRGDEAIVDYNSHIAYYEAGAPAVLAGVSLRTVVADDGIMTARQIAAAIRPVDIHQPPTGLICLENSHNRGGGTCYSLTRLRQIRDLAVGHGLPVHIDGARIFNAAVARGYQVSECADCADSMMFCLSKGLAAPVGSILVGDREFIARARRWRKVLGGGMRQAGVLAAAGLVALREMPERLAEDHRRARRLAEAGRELGLQVDAEKIETNIVVFDSQWWGITAVELQQKLKQRGILTTVFDRYALRMVTHYQIDDEMLERAIAGLAAVLNRQG